MAEHSAIQWTNHTWNPWHGCRKVSPGCAHCYMFAEKRQYGQEPTLVVKSKTKFRDPLKWKDPRNRYSTFRRACL
jgi:phage protein Gp37/Gp68